MFSDQLGCFIAIIITFILYDHGYLTNLWRYKYNYELYE